MRRIIRVLALAGSVVAITFVAIAQQPKQPAQAAQPEAAVTRIRVAGNVQTAKLITQVPPVYPAIAKMAHIQGTVRLQVIVAKDGSVKKVTLISGSPMLVTAATDSVRQWRYQPTLLNGQPVEVITQVDVDFTLARSAPSPGYKLPPAPGFVMPTPVQQAAEVKAEKDALAAVDPTEAADIRQLLDAMDVRKSMMQGAEMAIPKLEGRALARVPSTANRQQVIAFLTQRVLQRLRTDQGIYDVLIPIYARHFSDQEIRAILAFYRSPVGQKFVSQQTLMMREVHAPFMAHWKLIVMPPLMKEFLSRASQLQKTHPAQPAGSAR